MVENGAVTLPVGWVLKQQYRIEAIIGCGGFGITYLAIDMHMNRRVAVKEFYPNQSVTRTTQSGRVSVIFGQEEFVDHLYKRFWEEGKMIYALKDVPDMLQVYHVFEENNTAYIVMEYLDGNDLAHFLRANGPLTYNQFDKFMRMILVSLDGIHKHGLIHRDISPDNIFITKDGRAKLIDFGSLRGYNMNQEMTTILKHNFAPYEQYQVNGKQGPWTDIYALSVTIYYALTGKLPLSAPDRLANDRVPPVNTVRPELPQNIVAAIAKGMAVKKEDRYQIARDMYRDLFPMGQTFYLQGISGVFANMQWKLNSQMTVSFGREKGNQIAFPPETMGVSRHQCSLSIDEMGQLYVRDDNSSYGTIVDGQRIMANSWTRVPRGKTISFGNESFRIVEKDE